jgi:hypothetical protein
VIDHDEIEKRKAEVAKLQERRDERWLNDVRRILSMPEGRRLLWRLLEEARVFHSTYTGNADTYFNEGKRSMGLLVLGEMLRAKPDSLFQMQKEAASDPLRVVEAKKGNS